MGIAEDNSEGRKRDVVDILGTCIGAYATSAMTSLALIKPPGMSRHRPHFPGLRHLSERRDSVVRGPITESYSQA